ncbi:two-component system response regulator RppA [Synechococcus elongatus]|uniref:two-component system response regulator RppA n=1 Tax=Synechococcus elongatus TaxID=32046 RepID=UPI0030D19ABB
MRLLLLEDEPDLGHALHKALTQERYSVDWLTNGDEAWAMIQTYPYRALVLDWMVPGCSGLELCQRLRQAQDSTPVLVLTARDGLQDLVQGLDAGADDYLVKPFRLAELLARVRALLRRSPQTQTPLLTVGRLQLDPTQATVQVDQHRPIALTAREFQLLEALMHHPGQILSRDQLLDQLWPMDAEPSSNVVAAQVRLLRRKLAAHQADLLIETVYGFGYRLRPS